MTQQNFRPDWPATWLSPCHNAPPHGDLEPSRSMDGSCNCMECNKSFHYCENTEKMELGGSYDCCTTRRTLLIKQAFNDAKLAYMKSKQKSRETE